MAIIANGNKGYTQDEFKEYLKTTIDAIVPEVSVSETNAKTSETNAATSATASANSATSSVTSAANSEASNQQSKKWAIATDSPDGTADTSSSTGKTQSSRSWALYSKDRALASETSATASANSAADAATHEANAKQSLVASQNVQKEVEDGLKKISSVVTYRGTVDTFSNLPTGLTTDNTGDMYNVKSAGGTDANGNEIKAGDNVVWNGNGWDDQSGHVDLSDYYTKGEMGKAVLSVVSNDDTLTFIHRDATKDSVTVNNVAHATKSTQDDNGNVITDTYETKTSHSSDINSINNTINTKCISSLTAVDSKIIATTVGGTSTSITVNNVAHAGKASQDDNGQAIDISALKTLITTTVTDAVLQCKKDLYPVGSVYVSLTNSSNPADILGFGTWAALPAGYGLVAQGTATAEDGSTLTFTAGQKSGEFKHQLTVGELPGRTAVFWVNSGSSNIQNYAITGPKRDAVAPNQWGYCNILDAKNYGFPAAQIAIMAHHNNVSACIAAYCWRRTA